MALIKCPECGKEVSDTSYKCTNCGYVIKKPKRGITGVIFKTLFVLFNLIMIFSLGMFLYTMSQTADTASASIAGASGFTAGVVIWLVIGLPLGIMSYITRPKISD